MDSQGSAVNYFNKFKELLKKEGSNSDKIRDLAKSKKNLALECRLKYTQLCRNTSSKDGHTIDKTLMFATVFLYL